MTEQEAEVFAARLTRVWVAVRPFTVAFFEDVEDVDVWHLNAMLDSEIELEVYTNEWGDVPLIRLDYRSTKIRPILCTDYDSASGMADPLVFDEDDGNPVVAAQWLSFFRRGCWLSGCPIEASAHEKAEWMQGFSREEIETWNLKI